MDKDTLLLIRISQASILVPFIVSVFKARGYNKERLLIAGLVLLISVTELGAFLIVKFASVPYNGWLYHINVVFYFTIVSLIYREILRADIKSSVFDIVIALFIILSLINSIWIQPIQELNSNSIVLASVVYIVYALYHYYRLLKEKILTPLGSIPLFWFSTGLLLFNSSTLFVTVLVNYLPSDSNGLMTATWLLQAFFNVMLNGFLTVALWKK